MKTVAMSCPKCNASIDAETKFCSHCGTAVVIDDEAMRMKYTYQQVDDARIREADVQEKIRLKELEIELIKLQHETQQKKTVQRAKLFVLSFMSVAVIAISLLFIVFYEKIGLGDDPSITMVGFVLILVWLIVLPKALRNLKE